jgi:hypothetical protein
MIVPSTSCTGAAAACPDGVKRSATVVIPNAATKTAANRTHTDLILILRAFNFDISFLRSFH